VSAFLATVQQITSGDASFVGVSDEDLESWIALATPEVNVTRWAGLYVQAVSYLAAHKYMMGPGLSALSGSAGGAVAERRARNWAVRYQPPSGTTSGDDALLETSYGREYLRMRSLTRRPGIAFGVV
jgi:hypothetical protein